MEAQSLQVDLESRFRRMTILAWLPILILVARLMATGIVTVGVSEAVAVLSCVWIDSERQKQKRSSLGAAPPAASSVFGNYVGF